MSNVRDFGATGDGKTDDTNAIRHAVSDGDGVLEFPPGIYRLSGTIEIPLGEFGPAAILGAGAMPTVIMAAAGPAFRLMGNHAGTGDPGSVTPGVSMGERMPTIRGLVVEGAHAEADGFELVGTMQAVIDGVMVRQTRHAIRLVKRNRNVLISNCHLYHNTGTGVFLDGVNLHQINIATSHISYNRLGGIRIERSEVRNLQITGNDIEYNNAASHKGLSDEPTAEIWIDTTADGASVNEVTIASNTIQATKSEGGCNIRIKEQVDASRRPGLITIAGNVIGSQENNVHITGGYGIAISGNTIYSATKRNLLIEDSQLITVGTNHFRRHTENFGTGVRLVRSEDCTITGCTFLDESDKGQESGASLLELESCERVIVDGCQLKDGVPFGVDAKNCSGVRMSGCIVSEGRKDQQSKASLRFSGVGRGNHVCHNTLANGTEIEESAGVTLHENSA